MSYYNNYNFSPFRYNNTRDGFNRNSFTRGYNNSWRPQHNQQPAKKHSGATFGYVQGEATRPYVRGWKFDKTHGLRAFIASPNKNPKRVKSKNGREWENWTAKCTSPHGVQLYNALYDVSKKRVYINDLGLVMSPNGGSGGYTGPYFRKRNR